MLRTPSPSPSRSPVSLTHLCLPCLPHSPLPASLSLALLARSPHSPLPRSLALLTRPRLACPCCACPCPHPAHPCLALPLPMPLPCPCSCSRSPLPCLPLPQIGKISKIGKKKQNCLTILSLAKRVTTTHHLNYYSFGCFRK